LGNYSVRELPVQCRVSFDDVQAIADVVLAQTVLDQPDAA